MSETEIQICTFRCIFFTTMSYILTKSLPPFKRKDRKVKNVFGKRKAGSAGTEAGREN